MRLRFSPASPFVRKVRIAAARLGLADHLELVGAETSDPSDSLRAQNPLGKIPALILEDGEVLYDSRVIVEFLDWLAGGEKLFPPTGPARFAMLTRLALADGISDAAVLLVYEQRWREPGMRSDRWREHQSGKIARGLARFEAAPPQGPIDAAAISLACTLGYLDLRLSGEWRAAQSKLVAWLDAFAAAEPSFAATRFAG